MNAAICLGIYASLQIAYLIIRYAIYRNKNS